MSKTEEQDDRHNFEDPTHPLYNYEKLEKIGEGTYGVVRAPFKGWVFVVVTLCVGIQGPRQEDA